ncbi:hypothetical protein AMECASPLE_021295 [Ameca splendens]|uniref:Uncharacterized protein n=1 Tax=Ameca splendens TaxID=208324 RepID=A0ABV0YR94_9TELE
MLLPNKDRMPHSAHTSRDSPTLPLFINTPFGAIKIPLPTTVPMMKDTAGSSPISLRSKQFSPHWLFPLPAQHARHKASTLPSFGK